MILSVRTSPPALMSVRTSAAPVSTAPLATRHRGFDVVLHCTGGAHDDGFAFTVRHDGLDLHTSAADYGSANRADRAARRFIDDALCVFDLSYTVDAEQF